MCNNSTIPALVANATNLPATKISCILDVQYDDDGVYTFSEDTFCGGSIEFRGNNQILDCQKNTVSSTFSSLTIRFSGSGPYIVQNCSFIWKDPAPAIDVRGSADEVLETVDILIKDTDFQGGAVGASFSPAAGKTHCASITKSTFAKNSKNGVLAEQTTPSSQIFLDLVGVSITSSNELGLRASGISTQLDVKDSTICSSRLVDVSLEKGAEGLFNNTICTTTNPVSQKSAICAMDCPTKVS
jgi:hypothetical protein